MKINDSDCFDRLKKINAPVASYDMNGQHWDPYICIYVCIYILTVTHDQFLLFFFFFLKVLQLGSNALVH